MHEMSLAQEIVRVAQAERDDRGFSQVISIKVQAGALSCFVPSALEFAFEVVREGSCAAQATLEIEQARMMLKCKQCGHVMDGEPGPRNCEECNSTDMMMDGNGEISITSMEVEE